MPKPLPMPQEELGVWSSVCEVSRTTGSSQGSCHAPEKSPVPETGGEEVELGLMALPELLAAAVRVLLLDCCSVCAHDKRRKTEGSGFYQKLRGLLVEVDLQVWEG